MKNDILTPIDTLLDSPPSNYSQKTISCSPEAEQLASIDWNFPDRVAHSGIEGLHPYPAKFVAELPRALLESLPIPEGTAVFDPFCGSGTTLVEAQRRHLPSIGLDLNPIACLITRVKTSTFSPGLEESAHKVVEHARQVREPYIPVIPNLDHWFQRHVQEALAALTAALELAPMQHQDSLRLALSSIIVRVSNQDSDTRYAAVAKAVHSHDVFSWFTRAAARIGRALSDRDYELPSTAVFEADTLNFDMRLLHKRVGLVITSPPYPNAYEYWLYHKYRMWWLGFDPLAVKEREIGARAHFFKRNPHTSSDFARQMGRVFNLLKDAVVPEGYVCFVVGRSLIRGEIIDNAKIIDLTGDDAGFKTVFSTERIVSPSRKSFNLSHANIKTETILVLKNNAS